MNASFPDYDFSTANPEVFIPRDLKSVLHTVNASLAELTASNPTVLKEMWKLIDEVYIIASIIIIIYLSFHFLNYYNYNNFTKTILLLLLLLLTRQSI